MIQSHSNCFTEMLFVVLLPNTTTTKTIETSMDGVQSIVLKLILILAARLFPAFRSHIHNIPSVGAAVVNYMLRHEMI